MQRKVTLSIDDRVYRLFKDVCEKNAIMLSKKIELFMKEFYEKSAEESKKRLRKNNEN